MIGEIDIDDPDERNQMLDLTEKYHQMWRLMIIDGKINPMRRTLPRNYPIGAKNAAKLEKMNITMEDMLYSDRDVNFSSDIYSEIKNKNILAWKYWVLRKKMNPIRTVFSSSFPLSQKQQKKWVKKNNEVVKIFLG
jgi:hypothetical protein